MSFPGIPMSDEDLAKHFEASKIDAVGLVGSEVRQLIGELRYLRTAMQARSRELDEADRRAGAAERNAERLKEDAAARAVWLAKAKRDAGFSDATSFDVVWAQALPLLIDARTNKQPPAMDGMPILDNGLNSVIEGALEIVRKRDPGMVGLIHNLDRLQEWIDLYVDRAKASADAREAWDWLTNQTSFELRYYEPLYGDDDDLSREWRIYRWSGPINDRERDIVGRGLSPLLAIEDARRALGKDKA